MVMTTFLNSSKEFRMIKNFCGNSRITEYQRLTTYGFDPKDKPSDGYIKDKAYDIRLTTYGLRLTTYGLGDRIPKDNPY